MLMIPVMVIARNRDEYESFLAAQGLPPDVYQYTYITSWIKLRGVVRGVIIILTNTRERDDWDAIWLELRRLRIARPSIKIFEDFY